MAVFQKSATDIGMADIPQHGQQVLQVCVTISKTAT